MKSNAIHRNKINSDTRLIKILIGFEFARVKLVFGTKFMLTSASAANIPKIVSFAGFKLSAPGLYPKAMQISAMGIMEDFRFNF